MAVAGSERYVRLAGLAALLAGAMLLVARLARLGFLANFLSRTVLVGFLAGVGIQVAAGQLPDMLGITAAGRQTLPRLLNTVRALPHAHLSDVAVSIGVIVIVVAARADHPPDPGAADRGDHRDHRELGRGPGQPRRGRGRARPTRAAQPGAARPRLARRRRAARRRGVDVRGHPGPERGHLPGLRRESTRNRSAKTPIWSAWVPPTPPPRSPARSWSTAARPRRRWSTARRSQPAVAAQRLRRGPRRPRAAHRAAGLPAGRRPGGGGLPHRSSAHRHQGNAAHPGLPETGVRRGLAHDRGGGDSGGRVRHRARRRRLDRQPLAARLRP